MTKEEKLIKYSERASHYLYLANVASDPVAVERLNEKSQYWHDRYNKLAGNW